MVDGVLASCHASVDHDLAHFTTIPMQQFPETMGWIFGDSFGFPVYLSMLRDFAMLILPEGQFFGYEVNSF